MNEHTQAYMVEVVKKFLDGGFDGDKWNYEVHDEIAFVGGIGGLDGKIDNLKFFTLSLVKKRLPAITRLRSKSLLNRELR